MGLGGAFSKIASSHFAFFQVMQMQQQPIKSMEKMVWKSPLGISQRQNAVPSAANGTLGRQAGRPGSLVNQVSVISTVTGLM